MSMRRTRFGGRIAIEFTKSNPIVWENLKGILQDAGFSNFNTGIAQVQGGKQYSAYSGRKPGVEWVYIPDASHTALAGEDPNIIIGDFDKVLEGIRGLFSESTKWDSYLSFFESDMNYEFEPESKKPLDIMKDLTPEHLYDPFKEAIGGDNPTMFLYRFAHWSGEVTSNIRKTAPWYDLQFFPNIENPDRFSAQIVCRSRDFSEMRSCITRLESSLIEFLNAKDMGGSV